MLLLLSVFFVLYGAVNIYAFAKVKAAFAVGLHNSLLLGVWMAVMTVAPILIRLLEKHGFDLQARLLSHVGYLWMGFIFLFFSAGLVVDVYRLTVQGVGVVLRYDVVPLMPSPRVCFFLPFFCALSLGVYGYFEAKDIRTEKITIRTSKLPKGIEKLRIVQVSDVHLGLIIREERLLRIIEEVERTQPDVLISTGDLVDGQTNSLSGLAIPFARVNPRYGKYAVMGNHEFYAGLPQALEFTTQAGFTVLRGEAVSPGGVVNLVGVDDPAGEPLGLSRHVQERGLLTGLPRERFTVLLKHQPVVEGEALGMFDLQVSGHTHKGQIFPFRLITGVFFRYNSGWFDLGKGSRLYVSPGTGTWGPPIRLLAPPEVTLYELLRE